LRGGYSPIEINFPLVTPRIEYGQVLFQEGKLK
jgi:hypothetical protein